MSRQRPASNILADLDLPIHVVFKGIRLNRGVNHVHVRSTFRSFCTLQVIITRYPYTLEHIIQSKIIIISDGTNTKYPQKTTLCKV